MYRHEDSGTIFRVSVLTDLSHLKKKYILAVVLNFYSLYGLNMVGRLGPTV